MSKKYVELYYPRSKLRKRELYYNRTKLGIPIPAYECMTCGALFCDDNKTPSEVVCAMCASDARPYEPENYTPLPGMEDYPGREKRNYGGRVYS